MIDASAVREAFSRAREAVAEIDDEDYRRIAFQVVFSRLLDATSSATLVPGNISSMSRDLTAALTVQHMSVGEFLSVLDLTSYVERVTAVAYHYLHALQQDAVTRQEFVATFRKVRLTPPKNISDVIAKCIRRGLLMDASEPRDGQKAWTITQRGERLIEEKLRAVEQ